MPRPREHDEHTRERLLVAAGRALAADGAPGLSVRRLSDDVGVSTRAVYSLFGSKEGLVREMYVAGFRGLADELDAAAGADDPLRELQDLALAYRRSALDRPHLYEVMFACPVPEFEPTEEDAVFALSTLGRLRDAVARAIAAGAIAGDVEEVTYGLWGLVHGLASLELAGAPATLDTDAVWDRSVTAMLDGLAARGG